jgi:hypothetical protein
VSTGRQFIGEKNGKEKTMSSVHNDDWLSVESETSKRMKNWLNKLTETTCSETENDFPKTLFVLDNDYGELTTILYLIQGQSCFSNSKLALSPRVFQKNKNVLPDRVVLWESEQDLVELITSYQPKVLVLAAGYLIPVHDLLTNEALERICQLAKNQNTQIVTADPFLGLLSEWSPKGLNQIISIDIPTDADENLVTIKRQADLYLHTRLGGANAYLKDFPHLYPTYTDMEGIASFPSDEMNRSFFNDQLIIPEHLQTPIPSDKPHWIFIISEVDFQTQSMHLGVPQFISILIDLLIQGANLDRKIIFLGPGSLIEILRSSEATLGHDIHLFNFGAYEVVMSLLLTAEYSFYWNVVSHTVLIQLWNGRPIVLLDKGHLARSISNLYERVIAWYYQGWEPRYFDQNEPLSLEKLAEYKHEHAEQKDDLMKAYRRALSPESLFKSLVEGKYAT